MSYTGKTNRPRYNNILQTMGTKLYIKAKTASKTCPVKAQFHPHMENLNSSVNKYSAQIQQRLLSHIYVRHPFALKQNCLSCHNILDNGKTGIQFGHSQDFTNSSISSWFVKKLMIKNGGILKHQRRCFKLSFSCTKWLNHNLTAI